jgi:hypothetical protein
MSPITRLRKVTMMRGLMASGPGCGIGPASLTAGGGRAESGPVRDGRNYASRRGLPAPA